MRSAAPERPDLPQEPRPEGYPLRDEAVSELSPPLDVDSPTAVAPTELIATEPFDPTPRRRRLSRGLLGVLVLVLLAAGLGAGYVASRRSPSQHLSGPGQAAASPSVSTSAGAPSTRPTTTAATTTAEPPKVDVPRVVGDSLPTAIAALKHAGLVALVSRVVSTLPSGQVVGQSPGAGATERKDGRVR